MTQNATWGETEGRVRRDLAALYRLIAHFRMTDLIDTHISARIPGTPDHFLINRYGVLFHEVEAADLIKIDTKGDVIDPADAKKGRVNTAGFTIHSAIHMARHDVACVIHTHTADGMAVAAQANGLLPITQHALNFYGRLGYHPYEGIALDLEERERLVASLGLNDALILRNHGLLAVGRTIPEAFQTIYLLERACQAQVKAMAGGTTLTFLSSAVCERTAQQYHREGSLEYCELAWNSALRLLD